MTMSADMHTRGMNVRGAGARSRPLLARVAESMYWMSRYVERSEHVARVILENNLLLTDVGDMPLPLRQALWRGLLDIFGAPPPSGLPMDDPDRGIETSIPRYMALEASNFASMLSCVTSARENARSIRENISGEMWENLNTLYWTLRAEDAAARSEEAPGDMERQVVIASMLFQGMVDQTLAHGPERLFIQFGKFLERIDMTCRILKTRFAILHSAGEDMETTDRNIHWMSLLRSYSSIEAYCRMNPADLDPMRVVSFLILEPSFPRSVRYCVAAAHDAVMQMRAGAAAAGDDAAERALGRLRTQLDYADVSEIFSVGLPAYLDGILDVLVCTAADVRRTYFLH